LEKVRALHNGPSKWVDPEMRVWAGLREGRGAQVRLEKPEVVKDGYGSFSWNLWVDFG
jgi:hypothetical protein